MEQDSGGNVGGGAGNGRLAFDLEAPTLIAEGAMPSSLAVEADSAASCRRISRLASLRAFLEAAAAFNVLLSMICVSSRGRIDHNHNIIIRNNDASVYMVLYYTKTRT
mmetsp:Transcript_140/g.168  ORF Transcript_140/g.168 Transcript_140/m.168 type:complete len:108 (-) Transcript_140:192-515(-)